MERQGAKEDYEWSVKEGIEKPKESPPDSGEKDGRYIAGKMASPVSD